MGTYPFQWFWDSCFHAVVLSHIDPARAQIEIRSLLANAQPDGFVAHVTFWQREKFEELLSTYSIAYRTPYLSDCMQPPVLAEAVAAASRGPGGDAFLAEVLPKVRRYYDWLDRVRDPDRDGLIATLQPDESGLDHTPKYDAYLGVTVPDLAGLTAAWERVAGPYAAVRPRARERCSRSIGSSSRTCSSTRSTPRISACWAVSWSGWAMSRGRPKCARVPRRPRAAS